jgi:hypothetical protein
MMKETLLSNKIDASSSRIDILRCVPYSTIPHTTGVWLLFNLFDSLLYEQ